MEYDLRKDIDRFKHFLDVLEVNLQKQGINDLNLMDMFDKFYDQSEIDKTSLQFHTHLTTLNTDLTGLSTALNDFNNTLFHLDEANEDLETDLTELADNLTILTGMLDDFSSDLTDFQSELNDFDFQLNGDATHDGFVDTLTAIQTAIGDENTPSSLKGMLHDFGIALQGVASGDNVLSLSLTTLSGYLTAFEGTLQEFKTQISNDLGSSVYDGLDEQVINLIYSIANTKQDVDTHKDELDDLSDMIGNDTDVLADGTLYGVLNNTSEVASSASSVAGEVSDAINDTINPAIDTINNTDIPTIKNKMGYNNIPNGSTLQGQITSQGNTIGSSSDSASANTLFGKVKNAQNTADSVDTKVGEPSSTSTNTVFGSINSVVSSVGSVENAIGDVETKMYKGSNGTGTMQNPANGTVKKLIDTAQSDISDVQSDVGTVNRATNGDLATQMSDVKSIADMVIQTNKNWQLLWFGATNIVDLNTIIPTSGLKFENVHYAYDINGGIFKINDGIGWITYDEDIILDNVDFICGICNGFTSDVRTIADSLDLSMVFDLNTYSFYQKQSGNWVQVTARDYDYYNKIALTKMFNTAPNNYYSNLAGGVLLQQDVNNELYTGLQGKQATIPSMSLIETKTGHGVTGKVYSDGLMVHITLNGTATSISGTTTLFSFTETDYMPDTNTIIPVPRAGGGSTVRLATSGNVLFYPSNLNNSPIVEGTFTFPLKSRLPSEE